MGLRELFEGNRTLALGGAGALVLIGVISLASEMRSSRPAADAGPKGFFTVDDGASYFDLVAGDAPPFDYKGKQAVKANVYEAGGKKFVAYLERYTPEAQRTIKQTDELFKAGKSLTAEQARLLGQARGTGMQVKRPGDKDWVAKSSKEGLAVTAVKAPGGTSGDPKPVEP